jgi:hypothetical protein
MTERSSIRRGPVRSLVLTVSGKWDYGVVCSALHAQSTAATAGASNGRRTVGALGLLRESWDFAASEQVTWLDPSSRRIEFIVCIAEAEVHQNGSGRLVIRVMPGIQSEDAECREGARDNGRGSFAGKAAPPECDPELEA